MYNLTRLAMVAYSVFEKVSCDFGNTGNCHEECEPEPAGDRQLFQQRVSIGQTRTAIHDTDIKPRLDIGIAGGMFDHNIKSERQSTDDTLCEKNVFARPELCPAHCPFAAEMANKFCHFRCVKEEECGLLGTVGNATIPDEEMHACRHCDVEACMTCVAGKPGQKDKDLERCVTCMPGYFLTDEGECEMRGLWVFVAICVVLAVAAFIQLAWYLRVLTKPCINQDGVEYGVASRFRTMVLQKGDGTRGPYPLRTNLLSTNVAGAGTICFFRFQFALLAWAITLLLVWLGFAAFVSWDLLILGTLDATTPQRLCAVVRWGRARQMQLLWTKVAWLAFAYIFSFGCSILYAIQQTKLATDVDAANTTMSDFATVLTGLPPMKGKDNVEALIKEAVHSATGEQVVGVSVGWSYDSCAKVVEEKVERHLCPDLSHMETTAHGMGHSSSSGFDAPITDAILGKWHVHLHSNHVNQTTDAEMKQMLTSLESAQVAFVVFDTEQGRDKAVETVEGTGITVRGAVCTLKECCYEPSEIVWSNLGVTEDDRHAKLVGGAVLVTAACLAWTILLYLPYAHYMASFSYANGDEPGHFSETLFIVLVVCSQLLLFIAASIAANRARFHFTSQSQKTYTIFYTAALILNLVMDIVLQGYLSYLQMVGVGAHTASGKLLGELTSFQQIFESYPMQKSVGKLLFNYCWPCTFFVPFLAEPLIAQWLPQHIARLLVGADQRINGLNAVKAFELSEMEQGRYADVIFNVILVTCIPFISPAYLHKTLAALVASHVYLYCYDHVKVLRYVVTFEFSSLEVHFVGMQLFTIPVAIFAGALVLKANQLTGSDDLGSGVLQGYRLAGTILGAMVGHVLIHLLALETIKRLCTTTVDRHGSKARYADAADNFPTSYFNVNPLHCLRSLHALNQNEVEEFYSPLKG